MGRSQTIFLMIVFIFWPVEQSAFLDKLELQNPMWIRVKPNYARWIGRLAVQADLNQINQFFAKYPHFSGSKFTFLTIKTKKF